MKFVEVSSTAFRSSPDVPLSLLPAGKRGSRFSADVDDNDFLDTNHILDQASTVLLNLGNRHPHVLEAAMRRQSRLSTPALPQLPSDSFDMLSLTPPPCPISRGTTTRSAKHTHTTPQSSAALVNVAIHGQSISVLRPFSSHQQITRTQGPLHVAPETEDALLRRGNIAAPDYGKDKGETEIFCTQNNDLNLDLSVLTLSDVYTSWPSEDIWAKLVELGHVEQVTDRLVLKEQVSDAFYFEQRQSEDAKAAERNLEHERLNVETYASQAEQRRVACEHARRAALARVAERARLARVRLDEHEATLDQESKQRLREQQIAAEMAETARQKLEVEAAAALSLEHSRLEQARIAQARVQQAHLEQARLVQARCQQEQEHQIAATASALAAPRVVVHATSSVPLVPASVAPEMDPALVAVRKQLEKMRTQHDAFANNTEPAIKLFKNMKIKVPLQGAIQQIANNEEALQRVFPKIRTVIELAMRHSTEAQYYALVLLFTNILDQCDARRVGEMIEMGHAFSIVLIKTFLLDTTGTILRCFLAALFERCRYLMPVSYPNASEFGQDIRAFRLAAGYKSVPVTNDNTLGLENDDKFFERTTGYVYLLGGIMQCQRYELDKHPYSIREAWTLLAHICNLEPRQITPTIVLAVLRMCGHQLLAHYGQQFRKLLRFIQTDFVRRCEPVFQTAPDPYVVKFKALKLYLQDCGNLDHCHITAPEGSNLPARAEQ